MGLEGAVATAVREGVGCIAGWPGQRRPARVHAPSARHALGVCGALLEGGRLPWLVLVRVRVRG